MPVIVTIAVIVGLACLIGGGIAVSAALRVHKGKNNKVKSEEKHEKGEAAISCVVKDETIKMS